MIERILQSLLGIGLLGVLVWLILPPAYSATAHVVVWLLLAAGTGLLARGLR